LDEQRFDQLSRRFAAFRTRRQAMKAVAGAVAATVVGVRATAAQECTAHYSPCGGDGECCSGAVCEYGMCMPGCRVDGAFLSAWMSPPENICGQCQPEISTTSLAPVNEGMSCWSGDPNAGATFCRSGSCVPNAPQSCPPPTPCYLEGETDPVTGLCVNPPAPAGTLCGGQAMCHGGFFQPADTCDGNGFCIGGGSQVTSCGYYGCGADACLTSCAANADCIEGAHCDDGACLPDEGLGTPCDEDGDCVSGVCSDGVCCNQRCDGLCETCSAENGGICTPVICAALDQCHGAGVCDPNTGVCSNPPLADGTSCFAGNHCVTGDTCQDGVCVGGQQAVVCDSENPCIVDSCDPAVGCVQDFKIEGTSCDDGNPCDGDEVCDGAGHCVEGTPVVCQPPDQCHDVGICNPDTGECEYAVLPNGTLCNDGDSCTHSDTCQEGVCTGTPANLMSDPDNCGACGYDCSDVGGDTCLFGRCCGTTPVGGICCSAGTRIQTCSYQCGTYPCNCYSVPYTCNCQTYSYSCGLFGSDTCYETQCSTCYRTECSTCPQYCNRPCCV
jgi:hypothetical protein